MACDLRESLLAEMRAVFGQDCKRIDHTMTVLGWAERIADGEPGDRTVVTAAAILHDIGTAAAEARHGSAAARFQELDGPPIAREIMQRCGADAATTEHVCRIVANHHSARDIDTPEFRIVWDADWIVNIPGMYPDADRAKLAGVIGKVFRTTTGRRLAGQLLLEKADSGGSCG